MDLGLRQRDLAKELSAGTATVCNWETGRTTPETRYIPRILAFLGEDPRPQAEGLPARLRAAREALGLSQRALAARLGGDPSTVWQWEQGRTEPPVKFWPAILELVGMGRAEREGSIAERVLQYRRARGLTQAPLAARLGVRQQVFSEWERGRREPPELIRERLAARQRFGGGTVK